MLSLSDIGIYKLLSQRNTQNATKYSGILMPIVSDADYLLQYIKKEFPAYSDHGIQHSFRILSYLSHLIDSNIQESMSDTEIFCLIMSALFHDTGMSLFTFERAAVLRDKHHEFSSKMLDDYFKDHLKLIQQRDRLKSAISFACYGHGLSLQDLYTDNRFSKSDRVGFDIVRYSFLAILLRIGDLMDLEEGRVNEFVLSSFRSIYSQESLDHNIRHTSIQTYNYSSNELFIEVLAENVEQYKIWTTWFSYLTNDILLANTYLQKDSIHFPLPKTVINKADEASFDVEELRFEIDDKGGIWNILSQSVYTNELDFLRELLQNSIDAVLVNIYLNFEIKLNSPSPRSWMSYEHNAPITVGYSQKKKLMIVSDSGIGMNKDDLQKFLFKVTGSGYVKLGERSFPFSSIAKFGIGFISCLINADYIDVFTKKYSDTNISHVNLSSDSNLAFVQQVASEEPYYGTTIKLLLKHEFSYEEIEVYIKNMFIFPSVDITCINLDEIESVSKLFYADDRFTSVLDAPYNLSRYIELLISSCNKHKFPIIQKSTHLEAIYSESSNLIDWIKDNKELDDDFSDKAKYELFKEKIKNIALLAKNGAESQSLKGALPLTVSSVNIKTLFNEPDDYIKVLESFCDHIKKRIDEYLQQRKPYDISRLTIDNHSVAIGFDWKYCVVCMNQQLLINDIMFLNEATDLSNRTGIIFFNHEYSDYDSGVEYASISGFPFLNGQVCNALAKFTGYTKSGKDKRKDTFLVGSMSSDFDLQYDIEEAYWNEYDESDETGSPTEREYLNDFDAICAKDNRFLSFTEISLSDIINHKHLQTTLFRNIMNDMYERSGLDLFDHIEINSCEKFQNQVDYHEKVFEASKILSATSTTFSQDGIKLPLNIDSLFPFGVFIILCNCTTDSRIPLNVTRHVLTENRTEVDNWMSTAGREIQSSLIDRLSNTLNKFSLDIDIDELIESIRTKGYFAQSALRSFRRICAEKGL